MGQLVDGNWTTVLASGGREGGLEDAELLTELLALEVGLDGGLLALRAEFLEG